MKLYLQAFALFVSVLMPTASFAEATVNATSGGFLVFQGHGFVRSTQPTRLQTGDKVAVTEGNGAVVTYPDRCTVDVRPGKVHIVGPVSPCAYGQGADPNGERCRRARSDEERRRLQCPVGAVLGDTNAYAIAAGAAILFGGAVAGIALSGNDNDNDNNNAKPMSP